MFPLIVFSALLGYLFQQWQFLCSHAHVLAVWRPSHINILVVVKAVLLPTVSRQSVLASDTNMGSMTRFLLLPCSCEFLVVGRPSDDEMGLYFAIAAVHHHCSHSWVRAPHDSWPHFTASNLRIPQSGAPGPRSYIALQQSVPSYANKHRILTN
jgi:hypothetical protein